MKIYKTDCISGIEIFEIQSLFFMNLNNKRIFKIKILYFIFSPVEQYVLCLDIEFYKPFCQYFIKVLTINPF